MLEHGLCMFKFSSLPGLVSWEAHCSSQIGIWDYSCGEEFSKSAPPAGSASLDFTPGEPGLQNGVVAVADIESSNYGFTCTARGLKVGQHPPTRHTYT